MSDPSAKPVSLAVQLLAGAAFALAPAAAAHAQSAAPAAQGRDVVVVRAIPQPRSSVSRLSQPIIDTPQSIATIDTRELTSRAINNLNDALRNVPGLTLGAGEFSWQGNTPTIRGFVARNDLFLDGMRDFGSYYRDPFNLQQVEILQGPSGVYFGRGSTGGVVNQTSKTPLSAPQTAVTVAGGTADTYRATADINRPLSDRAALRVNLMAHQNDVAGRETGQYSRFGFAPSLGFELGERTRIMLSWLHQEEDNKADYGLPWYFGRPAPVDTATYHGFSDDFLETRTDILTLRVEHDLSPNVTLRNQLRYADYWRDFRITEAVLAPGVTAAQPLNTVTLSRNNMWIGDSTETFLQNQFDILARFQTGGIGHTLVAGFEIGKETSDPLYRNAVAGTVPGVNLVNPGPAQTFAAGAPGAVMFDRLVAETSADTQALFLLDTIRLSQHWEITGGVRWDRFDAEYRGTSYALNGSGAVTGTAFIPQVDEATTFRGALVYKPTEQTNIYAAFGTSFNPSAEGLSQITSGRALTTNNANLDPEENETWEIGAKTELRRGLVLSGAVFRLEKTNARVPDPTRPGFNMLGGAQRVTGAQIMLSGDITEQWYVSGGYTYLDSEVTASAAGAAPVGRPLINAPEHSATLLTEYHFTPQITAGAAVTYMDERLAQNTGAIPLVAPSFTTVDLMARYAFSEQVSVQLNVFNVFDEVYFDQLHPFHVVPGPARSALVTLSFRD